MQDAVSVYYAVAAPQDGQGARIGLNNGAVAVQGEDAEEGVIEQGGERGVAGLGGSQGLSDPDELAQVGQQRGGERELRGASAGGIVGVCQRSADVEAIWAV